MLPLSAVLIKCTVIDDDASTCVYNSYTLPGTPFYLKPIWFDTELQFNYSQYQIIWDLGDGTIVTGPSAQHYYKYPGIYNVTATFYDKNGIPQVVTSSLDSTSAYQIPVSLTAINVLPDLIVFEPFTPSKSSGVYLLPAGKKSEPLKIYRYNSWQNDQLLRANNYTINLYASGSSSDFLSLQDYYSDKYAHLRKYFGFIDTVINKDGIAESKLVDTTTTNAVSVYAKPSKQDGRWGQELTFYSSQLPGTYFAGTTGTSTDKHFVSYIDQTPGRTQSTGLIFIFAHPNTSHFTDKEILFNDYYSALQFPVYGYQNYAKWKVQYLRSIFNPAKEIEITSNGITVEGTQQTLGSLSGQLLHSFNIYPIKWTDSEISFCCTFKDSDYFTTKCYPPISGFITNGTDPTQLNTISLGIYKLDDLDPFTRVAPVSSTFVSSAVFKRNPYVPVFNKHGSYFCGTVSVPVECNVAVLCAAAFIVDEPPISLGIPYGFAGQPGIGSVKRFTKRPIFSNCEGEEVSFKYRGEYNNYSTASNANLVVTYAPLGTHGLGQDRVIIGDSDSDTIYFYSLSGTILNSIPLNNAPVYRPFEAPRFENFKGSLDSASPSNIATDSKGNIWVSLYDAVSCIKIDYSTLTVTACAVPTEKNVEYIDSPLYYSLKALLSGYTGENSLLPTCVDTDLNDGVFVGYSHPVSGFVFKYNSSGKVLTAIPINPLLSIQEILVDRTNSVWAIAKRLDSASNPFNVQDVVYKWDNNLTLVPGFPITTLKNIGNITIDLQQNLWLNTGFSELSRITPAGQVTTIQLGSQYNSTEYYQPIGGIACDTDGFVWVIHNYNARMYFYPLPTNDQPVTLPLSGLYYSDLPEIYLNTADGSRAFYSVFGDWTGIRWYNKYIVKSDPLPRIIRGSSNLFKIIKNNPVINKINENFDQTSTLKSYILQEGLFDKKALLDDFIGQIVGDDSSAPDTLGKKIYEKIANFVGNNSDVDTCNVDVLKNIFAQNGLNIADFISEYPPGLKRVVDMLTIKQSKLFGSPNITTYSFEPSGISAGANLGDEIPIDIGKFTVGEPVVIYELFSEKYEIVYNTVVPETDGIPVIAGQPYPLSGINYDWGWGLVTGSNAQSGLDIAPYYKFYKFKQGHSKDMVDGVIDFKNPLTTIMPTGSSYSDWTGFAGGMETILSRAMYNGLQL